MSDLRQINKDAINVLNTETLVDGTFKDIVDSYSLVSEVLKLSQKNINDSLIKKGVTTSLDAKLSTVPEKILDLPNMGGALEIVPPNVGAVVDTDKQEYNVTKINVNVVKTGDPTPSGSIFVGRDVRTMDLSSGILYVANHTNSIISLYPTDGTTSSSVISFGRLATSIIHDKEGFIHVIGGSKYGKYSPDGTSVKDYPDLPSEAKSIVVDSNNEVYIGDHNGVIRKINDKNEWSAIITINNINDMAIDDKDNLYCACNKMLYKISSTGSIIYNTPITHDATKIVVNSNYDAFFTTSSSGSVYKFNSSGASTFVLNVSSYTAFAFNIDNYDCLFYADRYKNMYKISPSAEKMYQYVCPIGDVNSFCFDGDLIYIGGASNNIYRIKDNYTIERELAIERRN